MRKSREVTEVSMRSFAPSSGSPRSARRPLARVLGAAALLTFGSVLAACSSGSPQAVGGGGGGKDPGGNGEAGSCLHDEPGCACPNEGAVVACGVVVANDGGKKNTVQCQMGGKVCTGNHWSACETNSNDPALNSSSGLKLVTGITEKSLSPGGACSASPCDPYCYAYPDNANGTPPGDAGLSVLGCGDASVLTVLTQGSPDASVAPISVLKDSGKPDGEPYIYIVLPTGQSTTRAFQTPEAATAATDIYFMVDDTSSMGSAASNLANALTNTTGIIQQVTQALQGTPLNFGVGRFEDFGTLPYAAIEPPQESSTNSYNLPYQHLLSMQNNLGVFNPAIPGTDPASECKNTAGGACTAAAVSWLTIDAFDTLTTANQAFARSGGDIPEASVAALWMMATGGGSFGAFGGSGSLGPGNTETAYSGPATFNFATGTYNGAPAWWQVPRHYWLGSPMGGGTYIPYPADAPSNFSTSTFPPGMAGSDCPAGTINSYPCFHANATPLIVLLSDAPAHEGPGGQYPHVSEYFPNNPGASPHLSGAGYWPPIPPVTATWAGGCPPGYDAAVQTGFNTLTNQPVYTCTLTKGTTNGTSFATAVPLPTGSDSLPVPGVYYGVVQNGFRAPGTNTPSNWMSASSVGSGIINIPAILGVGPSPFAPGHAQRSSLRDCGTADDASECTPNDVSAATTCFNNTVTGSSSNYYPSSTTYAAGATITYSPKATMVPDTLIPTNPSTPTTLAIVTPSFSSPGTDPGGTTALTHVNASNTPTATPVATGTVGASSNNATTYTSTGTTTVKSFYNIYAGTCSNNFPIANLTPGEEISNVSLTVNNIAQAVNSPQLAASLTAGGSSGWLTTPTLTTVGTSTSSGGYFANSTGGAASLVVTQATCNSTQNLNSTAQISITLTYNTSTPNACATGTLNGPLQYTTNGGAAYCPVCSTGQSWNSTASACNPVACSSGTQGTGAAGTGTSTSSCYSCTSALSTPANSPWTCSAYSCSSGTLSTAANTGNGAYAQINQCYTCSNGQTPTTSTSTAWTCPYSPCSGNYTLSPSNATNVTPNQCWTCSYANSYPGAVASTTGKPTVSGTTLVCPTTSATECVGYSMLTGYSSTTWTVGTGTGTPSNKNYCYNCSALPPATNTSNTLDQTTSPWQCSSCTPPAVLDTSSAPYKCAPACTGSAVLTPGGTGAGTAPNYGAAPTCNTNPGCAPNFTGTPTVNPTTCTQVNACTAYTGQAASGPSTTYDTINGNSPPGSGGWGINCLTPAATPACTLPEASSTQPSCYVENQVPPSGNNGGCTCQGKTYTAGTSTTYNAANNPCTGATPNLGTVSSTGTCAGGSAVPGPGFAMCVGSATAGCSVPSGPNGGEGYFGNDMIYTFTVKPGIGFGSRYYYHFALLAQGADSTSSWVTGGVPGGGTSVQSNVQPFLYLKTAAGTSINSTGTDGDLSYPYSIPASAAATDDSAGTLPIDTVGGANGPVLDCNLSAHNQLAGPAPNNDSYVISEIDGYLPPGTYYLVVDNAAPRTYANSLTAPKFQYFLQVGGFDDTPLNTTTPATNTQPSYAQMIKALNGIQAKFVGVENSGLSCLQPTDTNFFSSTSTAQFETKDYMEKIAYDLNSYDSTTNPIRPYVVSTRKDGTSCNPTCPVAAGACPAWCTVNYPLASAYDPVLNVCTQPCSIPDTCPESAANCDPGGYCTPNSASGSGTQCGNGITGLSCAVISAVQGLTSNLKQNVYLRPISTTAGSTYVAPGAACVPTNPNSPISPTCTGATPDCYGNTCTTSCTMSGGCANSAVCVKSTLPADPNYGYCVSPAVFISQVYAQSTDTPVTNPPTASDVVCGLHPKTIHCSIDADCPTTLPNCIQHGPDTGFCGIVDTGPDTIAPQPSYYQAGTTPQDHDGMFNLCSPKAQVYFDVTFTMPFQRSSNSQQYEFDLGIYSGAGLAARERVILENPALQVSDFYRFYDGKAVCPSGTHVVWGNFSYNALCPSDGSGNYSEIRFCGTTATSADAAFQDIPNTVSDTPITVSGGTTHGGCAPGETLLWIATGSPSATANSGTYSNTCSTSITPGEGNSCVPSTYTPGSPVPSSEWANCTQYQSAATCNASTTGSCTWTSPGLGFNIGDILTHNAAATDAGLASDQYLRIRMEFDPSLPGDVVAPFLSSWNLDVDCVPME